MMVFAAFGAAVGCWAGAIPHVIAAAGIDSFDLGLGFTLNSLAGVSAMALGGMIGRRFSNRSVMLAVLPLPAQIMLNGAGLGVHRHVEKTEDRAKGSEAGKEKPG